MSRDLSDNECMRKAQLRGDLTFTVVGQDCTSPLIICEWIKQNILTCPSAKLFEALQRAIDMREHKTKKWAD